MLFDHMAHTGGLFFALASNSMAEKSVNLSPMSSQKNGQQNPIYGTRTSKHPNASDQILIPNYRPPDNSGPRPRYPRIPIPCGANFCLPANGSKCDET